MRISNCGVVLLLLSLWPCTTAKAVTSNNVAEPVVAMSGSDNGVGTDCERGWARAGALEDAGEFSLAIALCDDLLAKFPTQPGTGKLTELRLRLRQEKRAAAQLSTAVETFESDKASGRAFALQQLLEADGVGAILLRKLVRKGTVPGAIAATEALEKLGDPKAITAYAERLKLADSGPLAAVLVRAFEARLRVTDRDRDALAEPFGSLCEIVRADSKLARLDVAGLLLRVLAEWFDGQAQPFDFFLKKPGAFTLLKEYVSRANQSPTGAIVRWAETRLATVGLANTVGLAGWWQLNERGGAIARDSTTNRLDGTLTNGPVWCLDEPGGGLRFDGTTNEVIGKGDAFPGITNTFTMTLWAYPTEARLAAPESNSAGEVTGTRNQRYAIFPTYGGVYGPDHAGAGLSIGTNGISVHEHANGYIPALLVVDSPLTNWTQVAVVYENRRPKLWINGGLVKTGLVSSMIVHPSQILGNGSGYGCFAGMIRDVRIYNRALSEKELAVLGAAARSEPVPARPN